MCKNSLKCDASYGAISVEEGCLNDSLKSSGNCRFCAMLDTNDVRPISGTILYENRYFFVVPALGCLIKNYIMIVSKRHINSMCYLNDSEKRELKALLNELRIMLKGEYGFCPIIFEHGASQVDTNKSACCVLHAHLHVVPYKLNKQFEMIDSLKLNKLNDFSDFFIEGYGKPYIFFMDNLGEIYQRSLENDALPSQIIRKWLAADSDQPSLWDWKLHPFNENITATVDELKPLIKKSIKAGDYRLKYVYYCRAMDGLDAEDVAAEYAYIQSKLTEQGRILVNPFSKNEHKALALNKYNADLLVDENLRGISKADCVIVNLSIKNHDYVGCIAEMIYAHLKGCYVIVITGDTNHGNHFYTLRHSDKICRDLDELFSNSDWHE